MGDLQGVMQQEVFRFALFEIPKLGESEDR